MFTGGRVNMIITKDTIKYAYQKQASQGLPDEHTYSEYALPLGTMKDGAIHDNALFIKSVKELIREQKWRRKPLAFCLVDDTVYIREENIPGKVTREEAEDYIIMHADDTSDFPIENPIVRVDILSQHADLTRVRFYAYPKDKLEAYEQAFTSAGLVPEIADFTFLSAYRYYTHTVTSRSKRVFLVNWGDAGLYVTGFDKDKAIFNRYIRFNLAPGTSAKQAVEPLRDIIMDLERMIYFYEDSMLKRNTHFEEIVLFGDFEHLYLAEHLITEMLDLPVRDLLAEYDYKNKQVSNKDDVEDNFNGFFIGGESGRKSYRLSSDRTLRQRERKRLMQAQYIDLFGLCLKSDK